ncbi:MAG: hypothetical protein ACKV0T_23180 [Planctomycetales bacterium]
MQSWLKGFVLGVLSAVVGLILVGGRPVAPSKTAQTVREAASPEKADVAVRRVLSGLKENRPEVLWEALPASYQRDLNETLHELARHLPADVWQETLQAIAKFSRLEQASLPYSIDGTITDDGEELQRDSRRLVEGLVEGVFQAMDAQTLENLPTQAQAAKTNVEDLWRQIGPTILRLFRYAQYRLRQGSEFPLFSELFSLQVTLKRQESSIAVVAFQHPDVGIGPVEIEFVNVEGKWVPRSVAAKWRETMDLWQKSIQGMCWTSGEREEVLNVIQYLAGTEVAQDTGVHNSEKLPSEYYLVDDLQYFPSGPEFHLRRTPPHGDNPSLGVAPGQSDASGVESSGEPAAGHEGDIRGIGPEEVDRLELLHRERAMTNQDVIDMVQAGCSDRIMLATIRTRGGNFDTAPQAIIALHNSKVSDEVILEMMKCAQSQPHP